jgi:hypothetical protein
LLNNVSVNQYAKNRETQGPFVGRANGSWGAREACSARSQERCAGRDARARRADLLPEDDPDNLWRLFVRHAALSA